MTARPGRLQSAFTAGEIDQLLHERDELKYFSTGAKRAENVTFMPQGGFRLRDGLRHVGNLPATAARLIPFTASNGGVHDLVFSNQNCEAWGATARTATFAVTPTAAMLPTLDYAQQLDTLIVTHPDLQPKRVILSDSGWAEDNAPLTGLPRYDFGASYVNAVPAVWQIDFVGLQLNDVFKLTVSGEDTLSIVYTTDMTQMATRVGDAIDDLSNTGSGITVVSSSGDASGTKLTVTFSGSDNEGDGWAVSGSVINRADAAILGYKITEGVAPGEPIMSATRGWPSCAAFFAQRLLLGGLKSLPNMWMASRAGDFYNFDERLDEANGPFRVPMDIPGGERIERIVPNRNLLIFTSEAEYWLAERSLSKTEAPNHVQSSRHGTARGVPIVENEGAALFVHGNGGVIGEFRYTDVDGNFTALDISLLASHLVTDVTDVAHRRATVSTDGHTLAVLRSDGSARLATLLREQDVTAFGRITAACSFKSVSGNGRNELSFITDRNGARRLERFEDGLLLDGAVSQAHDPATKTLTGLSQFDGTDVWCVADGHVLGPFSVSGGSIALPFAVSAVTVGHWSPPVVKTLPPPVRIGPNIVQRKKHRIHSVQISVIDTTSLAIAANGRPAQDIDLRRYGAPADVPELDAGLTGLVTVRGLRGFSHEPEITITQVRPGRLTVRSVTHERTS